jgi:hypothetical protein
MLPSRLRAHVHTFGARADAQAALLVCASYLFRLPPLLNARSTNSDAAVVGLQAMHLLRGELSPFLWGSGYQTSADSFVAALFFLVLGPTPLALMLSALTLHVVATCLVFATLRRRLAPWNALVCTLPLVVSPSSVHTYALYPPRQASLTLALAAFFAIDGAAREGDERRLGRWLFAGGLAATLAVSADPYPLVLLPAASLLAVLVARSQGGASWRVAGARLARFALGAALGFVPFVVLHRLGAAKSGPMGLTTSALEHHWKLLVDECLPWALSYKVYFARNVMDYAPWDAPAWFTGTGVAGAALLFAMVAYALVRAARAAIRGRASIADPPTRLGAAGAVVFPLAIGGFLVSVMVMDHFSMRYLAVLTLAAPFAVAPAAQRLGPRRFALAFAPHLLASAVGGWVGYGPFVRGVAPIRETPELADDYALFDLLRARGVRYAMADYWTSYRLTLLSREEIVVVPTNPAEDRYAPYRDAMQAAPVFAYVWDPGRSREPFAEAELRAGAAGIHAERADAGALRVIVVTRRAAE